MSSLYLNRARQRCGTSCKSFMGESLCRLLLLLDKRDRGEKRVCWPREEQENTLNAQGKYFVALNANRVSSSLSS